MKNNQELYYYKVSKVIKVVDGDTVDVMLDLGFDIHIKCRVRLMGIDAPETRTKDKAEKKRGMASKARLKDLLKDGLMLHSHGKGKFGRILGEFYSCGVNLNAIMVAEGHAKEYFGGER